MLSFFELSFCFLLVQWGGNLGEKRAGCLEEAGEERAGCLEEAGEERAGNGISKVAGTGKNRKQIVIYIFQ